MSRNSVLAQKVTKIQHDKEINRAHNTYAIGEHAESGKKNRNLEEIKKQKEIVTQVRKSLINTFGERIHDKSDGMRIEMAEAIEKFLQEVKTIDTLTKSQMISEILNDVLGFGPLQPLIDDPNITEIMVVGPHKVYIEQKGKLHLTDIEFADEEAVESVIAKIIAPLGRRCDESTPNVDARLPNGSRVSATVKPIALDGPYITIRKFSKNVFKLENYIQFGSCSPEMAQMMKALIEAKLNIIVSGGTGSGKTSLLNCLSSYINNDERIITIEDSAELQLTQPHVERYESRPPNVEGKGEISIRDLVIFSLRKRPDRDIVGEVRAGEAFDMLQAMNTGHDGSLTTIHANTPEASSERLESLVLMSGMDLPSRAIRGMIANGVNIVIQVSRMQDGSRKITHISEVVGLGEEGARALGIDDPDKIDRDKVYIQDIFVFRQTHIDEAQRVHGTYEATGYKPRCLRRIQARGIQLSEEIFTSKEQAFVDTTDDSQAQNQNEVNKLPWEKPKPGTAPMQNPLYTSNNTPNINNTQRVQTTSQPRMSNVGQWGAGAPQTPQFQPHQQIPNQQTQFHNTTGTNIQFQPQSQSNQQQSGFNQTPNTNFRR